MEFRYLVKIIFTTLLYRINLRTVQGCFFLAVSGKEHSQENLDHETKYAAGVSSSVHS